MKTLRKAILVITLLAALSAMVVPAFAQSGQGSTTRTVTVTEEQINSSFRVTNPPNRRVTDLAVDLQAGQAVISATFTFRNQDSFDGTLTLVPSVRNNRIFWSATAGTVNGEAASQELLNQINASISSSWRNYIREQAGPGRVTGVEVTDSAINITIMSR